MVVKQENLENQLFDQNNHGLVDQRSHTLVGDHLAKSVPPQSGTEMSDATRHQPIVNSVVEPQASILFNSDSTNVWQNSTANQASDSACGQGIFPFQINRVLNYFV